MTARRVEKDALGDVDIPSDALWGSSTERAVCNFPISGRRFSAEFIRVLATIKGVAAEVNTELGLIDRKLSAAIKKASAEIAEGRHAEHFPIDIFQTGSATSTNMNMNEVVANLANVSLGGKLGRYEPVHPNDHVNRCQSSNDIMPTCLNVAASSAIKERLVPALSFLSGALKKRSKEFSKVYKIGRTHLMDAMPITLGQEFGGFARQVERACEWVEISAKALCELAVGGTSVGTGSGAHPEFAKKACLRLSRHYGIKFIPAKDRFEALSSRGGVCMVSGALRTTAIALSRIADDIRLLASGPKLGLAEIELPALAPGSSIMPGKVNPIIPEMVAQVATQVMANDLAVAEGTRAGHLQLNTHLPVIASNLLESIDILANAANVFAEKCITGIKANAKRCEENIEMSLGLAQALISKVGYRRAAEVAKKAASSGRSVKAMSLEEGLGSLAELDAIFDVSKLTS
jgi:fumarate hydratase class II